MTPSRNIKYFGASGYKAFADPFRVHVAPLTIVFGGNGSGKSALVRLPIAIAAALRPDPDAGPGLPWMARGLQFGTSLSSLCHGGVPDRLVVELGIAGTTLAATIVRAPGSPAHLPGQWIEEWAVGGDAWHVRWDGPSKTYASYGVTGFRGLVPLVPPSSPLREIADALAFRVEHLSPRRDPGHLAFAPASPRPNFDVGSTGGDSGAVLASLAAHAPDALDEVVGALRRIVEVELDIQSTQVGSISGHTVQGNKVGRTTKVPFGELGTGCAHVLPVVIQQVAAARAGESPPDLLVVEEPESHLRPEGQAELADLFLDTARTGRSRCLVETHSETFILRVQRRVAEQPGLADKVRLVFIDDEGGVTMPRELTVAADGDVPGWPDGWFDTAAREAQAVHAARHRVRG